VKTIAHDQGAAENLRLLSINGRSQNLLPGSQLPVNLSQAGHDRHSSIDTAFPGQIPGFYEDGLDLMWMILAECTE
jgi:hypothetical protein